MKPDYDKPKTREEKKGEKSEKKPAEKAGSSTVANAIDKRNSSTPTSKGKSSPDPQPSQGSFSAAREKHNADPKASKEKAEVKAQESRQQKEQKREEKKAEHEKKAEAKKEEAKKAEARKKK